VVRRRLVPLLCAVAGVALVALLVYGLTQQGSSRALDEAIAAGRTPVAPAAMRELPVLDGVPRHTASLADWRGHIVIVSFWASWCPTCAADVRYLERAQRQLAASGAGTVLGIDYKDVGSSAIRYTSTHRLTFPNVRDLDGSFASVYGTVALPETFVLDARSRVVALERGPVLDQAWLTHAIAKAERI
jgi:cytochrome c biogenesis protein CcmG/thiol:disulfide interchange protein DsbE